MRARYYNQDIKHFINRDVVSGKITNSGSLNRYCYVQGNPVSLTDPFGLCPDSNSAFKNLCNNLYHMDWSAVGHAALDVAGIFFDGADVINAIWYACEGNMEMAAASAVCAIPALGMATGNLLMKSNKLAAAGKAVKAIAKMTQGVMGVCAGIEMAKTGFTNFLDGLEAGTFDAGALLQTLGGIGIAMLSGKGLASSGRELQACTGNSGKTMKGSLIDADISWEPVESGSSTEILALPVHSGTNPWLEGSEIIATRAPKNCYINMALAPGQDMPGSWGTFDYIPNVDYVRNNLAVTPEFKEEIGYVQKYLVPEGTPIQIGTVGPQKYKGITYAGGGNQVQILNDSDKEKLIPIGKKYKIY